MADKQQAPGLKDFRRLVRDMAQGGQLEQLKRAFERKLGQRKRDEAKVILDVIRRTNPGDDFVEAAREKLKRPRKRAGARPKLGFVPLEEYCSSRARVRWRNRAWLQNLVSAVWDDAVKRARFTVPDSKTRFRFPKEFQERTGALGLRFLVEDGQATARFDLDGKRNTLLLLRRGRPPSLGETALQGVLTAVAVCLYRDCLVLGATATHGAGTPLGQSQARTSAKVPYTVPRTYYYSGRPVGGGRHWSHTLAHSVAGHRRLLPPGWEASSEQVALAVLYGLILEPQETFVRPHSRGGSAVGERDGVSRGLAEQLFTKLDAAVHWA